MALVKCFHCEKEYSNSLNSCPHCGFTPQIFVCPECGELYGLNNQSCPICGFALQNIQRTPATSEDVANYLDSLVSKLEAASTSAQFNQIGYSLSILSTQIDVSEYLDKCKEGFDKAVESEQKEKVYQDSIEFLKSTEDSPNIDLLRNAMCTLTSLDDYKESKKYAEICSGRLQEAIYNKASSLIESGNKIEDFKQAESLLKEVEGYKKSDKLLSECAEKENTLEAAKKKSRKKLVLTLCSISAVVALTFATVNFFIPGYHYIRGGSLFNSQKYAESKEEYLLAGDFKDAPDKAIVSENAYHYSEATAFFNNGAYKDAISEFGKANDYSNSKEKIDESYYLLAKSYFDSEDYVLAAENFSLSNGYSNAAEMIFESGKKLLDAKDYALAAEAFGYGGTNESKQYKSYCLGMVYLKSSNYKDAVNCFKEAGNILDAKSMYTSSAYSWGLSYLSSKSYDLAKNVFSKCGNYKDSQNLVKICEAEQYIKEGRLDLAYPIYSDLPKNLTVEGFDAQGRIALILKYKSFASICNKTWSATKNHFETRRVHSSTGSSDRWSVDKVVPQQTLSIKCFINNNGTVNIQGTVIFLRFTNFSILKTSNSITVTEKSFAITNITAIPSSYKIDNDTTLNYSNGVFSISYSVKDNYSAYFYNLYKSTVTYGAYA